MPKMCISASWDVAEDQRANASLMHNLSDEVEKLEAKIEMLTGLKVRVELSVRRVKAPTPAKVTAVNGDARQPQDLNSDYRAV